MKIELIKDHTINGVLHPKGTVLDIDDATEKAWVKKGIAKSTRKTPDISAPLPASGATAGK